MVNSNGAISIVWLSFQLDTILRGLRMYMLGRRRYTTSDFEIIEPDYERDLTCDLDWGILET